ncbi:putative RNA-directed DNA polymerase [Tanacetum coccineum]
MNGKKTSIMELHSLLQTAEQGIKKSDIPSTSAAPVLTVGHNAKKRKTSHSNWKGKATQGKSDRRSKRKVKSEIASISDPKEAMCFYCNTKGHWKRSCPKYLKDLKDEKVKKDVHSASPCKGIYETVECISNDGNMILNVGSSNELDKLKLWHSRLGYGYEVFIRREAQDKLEARYEKYLFIGYPEESFGYLFYKPKDNVVFVARRGVFLEREMISKEDSRSKIDLEEIQESADEEPIINTDTQQEVVTPVEPDDISLPIRRTSSRVSKPSQDPQFYYGFHIEEDKISDSTLTELNEPANYKEAMASPEAAKWKEAMKSEIQSMYDNQVWNLVDTTPGLKTVGCKWIFKKKTNMDGKVHTYKARLVAKGYTQTHRIDYEETFSPVAKIKSIRIMLAIAAFHDYEIWQMDVKTAFLNRKLTEDVFMAQPEGFENEKYPKRVCKLQKAIYGLKQASRSWNLCFHEKVTQFGFSRSEDESCVYVKVSGSVVVFLVLYVDDILLIGNDIPTLQSVKDWLGRCFAMKDLGDATYILGIKIYRDRTKRLIGLSQDTYLDKILKRFRMENSKKGNLPLHHGIKISKDLCPKTDDELDKMSRVPYASAIGSIMYAMTCTRPDVSFALSMVSRHQQNPGEGHWTAVKNILRYLRNTKDRFLVYGGEKELRVTGYCDAGWQTDKDDSRSQSGWVFLLNGGAVTWKSSKQDTVADSTCESRKYHFVRSKVEEGHVIVKDIQSEDNPADPFTKALAKSKHDEHAWSIGLKDKIKF